MRQLLPLFALLTLAPPSEAETSRLDELLAARDYRTLVEVLDKRPTKDDESIVWLKSHSNPAAQGTLRDKAAQRP